MRRWDGSTTRERSSAGCAQSRPPLWNKPGRDLGYTRHDILAEALGCYAEYVEEPEGIRPALDRAWRKVEEGRVGFVNVKTDYRTRATTVRLSNYMT